ncbi:hypothetical protein [Sulfurimonas sp.]|nr:hypothetical protein [Sulfurimonas sp.]
MIELGYIIQSTTLDAKKGLNKAFKDIPLPLKKDSTTIYYNETKT